MPKIVLQHFPWRTTLWIYFRNTCFVFAWWRGYKGQCKEK